MELLDVFSRTHHGLLGDRHRFVYDIPRADGRAKRDKLRPDCLTVARLIAPKPIASHPLARIYSNEIRNISLSKVMTAA
jgi:hypothetical protein